MKLLITLAPGLEYGPHADIIVVDWNSKQIIDKFRYDHRFYKESHKGFAGATIYDGRLIASTEVELVQLDLAPLRLHDSRSYDYFNDVHDVKVAHDRIWVCNSGLDCVEEFDLQLNYLKSHYLVRHYGRDRRYLTQLMMVDLKRSWGKVVGSYEYYSYLTQGTRFRNVKKFFWPSGYRQSGRDLRYMDFRPHFLHPNHLQPVGNDIWVTLFSTGQIVSLREKKVLAENLGRPHDGIISNGRAYITDCKNRRVVIHEFNETTQTLGASLLDHQLPQQTCDGFVRGLAPFADRLFVGLTAKRGTPEPQRFARVASLRPDTLEPTEQWQIPNEFGNAIFSILDVSQYY